MNILNLINNIKNLPTNFRIIGFLAVCIVVVLIYAFKKASKNNATLKKNTFKGNTTIHVGDYIDKK